MRSFVTCTLHQILLGWLNHGGWDGQGISAQGGHKNAYTFLIGKLERKRPLGKPKRKWEDNMKTDVPLSEMGWETVDWILLAHNRLLWTRLWNFWFHKKVIISWPDEWLLASREVLCSMKSGWCDRCLKVHNLKETMSVSNLISVTSSPPTS
jgi:hypothetical protein